MDSLDRYVWGKKEPKRIVDMATDHIMNCITQIDERRTELMRELAELNVKAQVMKRVIEKRKKHENSTDSSSLKE
jgi:hypothetical protein